jgi:hypothetical protein
MATVLISRNGKGRWCVLAAFLGKIVLHVTQRWLFLLDIYSEERGR